MSDINPKVPPTYRVTSADLQRDADAILSLWRQHHNADPGPRYDWMFRKNTDRPSCLLLRKPDDTVIGTSGVVHRRFHTPTSALLAGHTIDLVIDRAHRSGGPAIQLQRAIVESARQTGIDLLYAVPVRAAELIQRRIGFRVLTQLHRWTKPLRFETELQNRIRLAPARRLAGALLDTASRWYSGEILTGRSARLRCFLLEGAFDARFDALWSTAKSQFALIGQRDAAYLNWRFGAAAPGTPRVFCLADRSDALAGYIVFRWQENTVHIADLLFTDTRALRTLLACFSRQQRAQGAHFLTMHCVEPPRLRHALAHGGFFRRPENANVLVYVGERPADTTPDLLDAANWYLTDADRDV